MEMLSKPHSIVRAFIYLKLLQPAKAKHLLVVERSQRTMAMKLFANVEIVGRKLSKFFSKISTKLLLRNFRCLRLR